jgi:hypothetical protein
MGLLNVMAGRHVSVESRPHSPRLRSRAPTNKHVRSNMLSSTEQPSTGYGVTSGRGNAWTKTT